MSRGPGQMIEQRIGDLFAASPDRALSVDDICDHTFALAGKPASRAQRLSAIRAAHRLLRRVHETAAKSDALSAKARKRYRAIRGRPRIILVEGDSVRFEVDPWRTTTIGKGRAAKLFFHAPDVPVRVWAVTIDRSGVHWFDAEITKVTERNIMVRYAGAFARLDRTRLWLHWAWWRGVLFVSSRTGRIAAALDELWWERYGSAGSVPPAMQMPLADAITLLGVPENYTQEDAVAAFRRAVKKAHPDLGGTADDFRKLVEARDRLLAALGTSEPPPKMPAYYPSGMTIVYRSGRGSQRRLGQTRRLALG